MTGVFNPEIVVPAVPGALSPDDTGLTPEQRGFTVALRRQYRIHCEAMACGDVERLLSFFTEDAVWMGSGWPTRCGKGDLRALFQQVAGTAEVRCESLCACVSGSAGWNFVDYFVHPKDPAVTPWVFRTVFAWIHRDAQWVCTGVLCYTR